MKRSLIYILIAVLTIGVSATILSRLPGKESEVKVQYDFNSIEEFEEYTLEKITENPIATFLETLRESEVCHEDVIINKVNEINSAIFFDNTKIKRSTYLDNDIFYSKAGDEIAYMLELQNSNILQIFYDTSKKEYEFSVMDYSELNLVYEDSFLKNAFLLLIELMLISLDESRNEEVRMMDFEVGKLKGDLVLCSFEWNVGDIVDDEVVQKWEKKENLMFSGDFKINFENEKIEFTPSDYDQMVLTLNEFTLSKHQLSHIVIQ